VLWMLLLEASKLLVSKGEIFLVVLKNADCMFHDIVIETSSKSTKLVHGGIRYLEKAFMKLDWEQYKLVREALAERSTFLQIAPHLAGQLPIMLPLYK
jgi:glycerol-3-phosphate dehydrogenase